MLSQKRIKELREIVLKAYPRWVPFRFNVVDSAAKNFLPSPLYLPRFSYFGGCCGAGIGLVEMQGLYELGKWREVDRAIFALMLNDNPCSYLGMFICISAHPFKNEWSEAEKTLLFAGFHPVTRGINKAHGPNHLTMWVLNTSPERLVDGTQFLPSLLGQQVGEEPKVPGLTPPEEKDHAVNPAKRPSL